ncbi:hypothetical protein E1294_34235 [Nonomuraea diastatica]|uniref:Uncharacterized protein n=1 Tax=Nonomuraea diastatica TaxID=1848329 RepID=A0A4R4WBG3_9ACTN|nr:hypothetical protein [Nonomuraea diastatica]TDD15481.1 hypothetical protein E1294_34235 [Nonomuraea diastatica]
MYERSARQGRKVMREYVLLWSGGEEWLTLTEEHIEDLAGLGKVFVERVSESLRPKVAAALARGESYLFPRWGDGPFVELTAEGVGGDDGVISWHELAAVDVQAGHIVIRGKYGQALVRSWGDTGNAGMLVAMLRSSIANSVS